MVARKPQSADTIDQPPDPHASLRMVLNSSPGVLAISASIRYEDGHIERVTVSRPVVADLKLVK